jgi:hypothetical protein
MSDFLLLAAHRGPPGELSPMTAARSCAAASRWHEALRRWSLLSGYAVRVGPRATPTSCLVVHASGRAAARRLADGWERVCGYDVAVLPIITVAHDG